MVGVIQGRAESNHWRKPVAPAFWPLLRYQPHQRSELYLSSEVPSLRPLTRSVSRPFRNPWLTPVVGFDKPM